MHVDPSVTPPFAPPLIEGTLPRIRTACLLTLCGVLLHTLAMAQPAASVGPAHTDPVRGVLALDVEGARPADGGLVAGDVIHAVNGAPVASLAAFRAILTGLDPDGDLVLQVERDGQLTYVAIERSGTVLRRAAR